MPEALIKPEAEFHRAKVTLRAGTADGLAVRNIAICGASYVRDATATDEPAGSQTAVVVIGVVSVVAIGIAIAVAVGAFCVIQTLNKAKKQRLAAAGQTGLSRSNSASWGTETAGVLHRSSSATWSAETADVFRRGESKSSNGSAKTASDIEYNTPPLEKLDSNNSGGSGYSAPSRTLPLPGLGQENASGSGELDLDSREDDDNAASKDADSYEEMDNSSNRSSKGQEEDSHDAISDSQSASVD